MLTRRDVRRIFEDDWEIVFKKGRHPKKYMGLHMPEENQSRVYLPSIPNKRELYLTIIHELIHARDDLRRKAARSERSEGEVESEARETYKRNPRLIEFILDNYCENIT